MRILKVVQAYHPFQEKGGPAVKVRALARGLARRGNQVSVLTADLGLSEENNLGMKIEPCEWGWRSEEDGIEAIYLSTMGHYRALTFNPHMVGFCRSSLKKFDLVHFYGLYDLLGPTAACFCRHEQMRYVIEPMGMYRPIDRSFRLKRLWHLSLGSAFWRKAGRIIATSELEHQQLLEDGVAPEKLVIRYNGIEADSRATLPLRGSFRAKWRVPRDQPLILFLSRLIPRKGADILIDAFAKSCPNCGWLVIAGPEGESGYRGYLEKRARESGVQSRILFTGPQYGEDKKAVMVDADLFVLPSRYENFANAAAEAIASGTPVIVSNFCGIGSLIDRQAGLIIAPEKEALAQALQRLLDDQVLYAQLQKGCRRIADQLNWDRLTEQMEGYYAEALQANNGVH